MIHASTFDPETQQQTLVIMLSREDLEKLLACCEESTGGFVRDISFPGVSHQTLFLSAAEDYDQCVARIGSLVEDIPLSRRMGVGRLGPEGN